MKRFLLGLVLGVVGALLCAVNWLAAALYLPSVTEWDTQKGKMATAWDAVGHQPLAVGVVLVVVGVALVLLSLVSTEADAPES